MSIVFNTPPLRNHLSHSRKKSNHSDCTGKTKLQKIKITKFPPFQSELFRKLNQSPVSQASVNIYAHIAQLKPYSLLNDQKNLEEKLDHLVDLHQKSNQTISFTSQKNILNQNQSNNYKSQRNQSNLLHLKCQQIIKPLYVIENKRKREKIMKFKTQIDQKYHYQQEDEILVAENMISKLKQQKKSFKAIMNSFKNKIAKQYERKVQDQDYQLKRLIQKNSIRKNKVELTHSHQRDEQQLYNSANKKQNWKIDKDDYYQITKRNRIFNISKIKLLPQQNNSQEPNRETNFVKNYILRKNKFRDTIIRINADPFSKHNSQSDLQLQH